MEVNPLDNWQQSNFQNFWSEIAVNEHLVQIYENESVFLNTLEGFVGSGFIAGDTVVIIATQTHLQQLKERLTAQRFDVDDFISSGKLIALDAEETLALFMRNGWPDEKLFMDSIREVFKKAKSRNSPVRAFGEMVAILWEQQNHDATVHLEHLWNKFCSTENFCLYCAYPQKAFTKNPAEAIKNICCTHSKVIAGFSGASTQIHYT